MYYSTNYLTVVVPLGIDGIVDRFGAEFLRTDRDDGVGIRFTRAEDADVHLHQLLGFDDANAQDTLQSTTRVFIPIWLLSTLRRTYGGFGDSDFVGSHLRGQGDREFVGQNEESSDLIANHSTENAAAETHYHSIEINSLKSRNVEFLHSTVTIH